MPDIRRYVFCPHCCGPLNVHFAPLALRDSGHSITNLGTRLKPNVKLISRSQKVFETSVQVGIRSSLRPLSMAFTIFPAAYKIIDMLQITYVVNYGLSGKFETKESHFLD